MWDDWDDYEWNSDEPQQADQDFNINFDFFSALARPKDYYKILEVDYDATDEAIRSNYIRLALKWHPDKKKDDDCSTSRFQEINEAYQGLLEVVNPLALKKGPEALFPFQTKNLVSCPVLSNPIERGEYDKKGLLYVHDYNIVEYLDRHKGLILTCNGLGLKHSVW